MIPHTSGAADLPEALRLADLLLSLQTHMGPRRPSHPDDAFAWDGYTQASQELRRLHSENERLAALAAGQAVAPAEPTPDELRAIAREARNSSGSASDDCGSAAYVLYGWRAAMSKVAPPAMDGEDAGRLERERICAAIKAEDDYCVDHGDYMLDSDDCIKIVRGEWVRPDFAIHAARAAQKEGEPRG